MTEDDDWSCGSLIICLNDRAADDRLQTEARVVPAGYRLPLHDLSLFVHHRGQLIDRSESEEGRERGVWCFGQGGLQFFIDVIPKYRPAALVGRLRHKGPATAICPEC